MNRILHFVREKAFVLILLGSIAAAVGTGIWAIRTVQENLSQDEAQAIDDFWDAELEGDGLWDEPADIVTDEMNGEIAMDETDAASSTSSQAQPTEEQPEEAAVVLEPGSDAPSVPPESSTDYVGDGLSLEPSAQSGALEPQAGSAAQSFVLPVSGAILQAFSGDELVYNETLGDWRTHNGVDYSAALGEEVIAPVTGQITEVYADGNWGGVVSLVDEHGYTWRFCGVENSTFAVGDIASIGDVLGTIGEISAESAAEPHLHLEILYEGEYQNPTDFLR